MLYKMLLWPHANARYQNEAKKLARAELSLTLDVLFPGVTVDVDADSPLPCLTLDTPRPLSDAALEAVRSQSLMYGLFEALPDDALRCVAGRAPSHIGDDLPAILKYKGKTNEMFLQLLINAALYSGDYYDKAASRLEFLDPMCGRATGPFVAANRGWNATGADVDRADLREAEKFFKRYLEYHRFKHNLGRESLTVRGKGGAETARFDYACSPELFKTKDLSTLRLTALDATLVARAFGRNAFHIIACDLPYGVRHDAQPAQGAAKGKDWLESLLRQALPGWRDALMPGGTIAVSFNAQTFPTERVRALMDEAGLEVKRGGVYDHFSHWVEQAITRDIAVCRKPH